MKPLIFVGGGGHCKSVIEAAQSTGMQILGILDPVLEQDSQSMGCKILGGDELIEQYAGKADFVITVGQIGDCTLRKKIASRIDDVNGTLGTVIASTAYVSRHSRVGPGTVVLHGAVVNAGAEIGMNCIINTLSNIEHDAVVEDFCHISTGVMVNGNCRVGEDTFIGSQAALLHGISITKGCTIGAGSLVRKSIGQRGVYAGNPAILIKKL